MHPVPAICCSCVPPSWQPSTSTFSFQFFAFASSVPYSGFAADIASVRNPTLLQDDSSVGSGHHRLSFSLCALHTRVPALNNNRPRALPAYMGRAGLPSRWAQDPGNPGVTGIDARLMPRHRRPQWTVPLPALARMTSRTGGACKAESERRTIRALILAQAPSTQRGRAFLFVYVSLCSVCPLVRKHTRSRLILQHYSSPFSPPSPDRPTGSPYLLCDLCLYRRSLSRPLRSSPLPLDSFQLLRRCLQQSTLRPPTRRRSSTPRLPLLRRRAASSPSSLTCRSTCRSWA